MPAVKTAEEAVEIAEKFLERYHPFLALEEVKKERDAWSIEFDIGALKPKLVRIRVDARTGKVVDVSKAALKS